MTLRSRIAWWLRESADRIDSDQCPSSCSTMRVTRIPGPPQPLPRIEDAFVCDPDCPTCHGEGHVLRGPPGPLVERRHC